MLRPVGRLKMTKQGDRRGVGHSFWRDGSNDGCRSRRDRCILSVDNIQTIYIAVAANESKENRWTNMETITMETVIILVLIAFIAGMMLGVSLARPTFTR